MAELSNTRKWLNRAGLLFVVLVAYWFGYLRAQQESDRREIKRMQEQMERLPFGGKQTP